MRNIISFCSKIVLIFTCFIFITIIYSAEIPNNDKEVAWKKMLISDIEENRFSAQKLVLNSHEDTIKSLLSILNSPLKENENFYLSNTSRNIAISILGQFRAKEAVVDLTKWLLPKPGQNMSSFEETMLSPAGKSLIEIGLPSVSHLIKLLKSGVDNSLLEQCIKILVSIKGLTETEMMFDSLISKEKDESNSKNLKKAFDFMKDPKIHKILERIDESRPNKVE